MYLSRLILDARKRTARKWLADLHALHRFIMSGFPTVESPAARAELGVLYRVERMVEAPNIPVLVQSKIEPRWELETDAVREISKAKSLQGLLNRIEQGGRYRFRLRANPSRRVHQRSTQGLGPQDHRKRPERPESVGKRVEITREEDQVAWLRRRGDASGFAIATTRLLPADEEVLELLPSDRTKLSGKRRDRQVSLGTVLFEGTLEVTDAARFREVLVTGVGPGKAFGCGLLSISPANRLPS